MISINAKDGRLSIIGYQPEVKRIYWSALPNDMPEQGEPFYYDGCEIKAIYADGSEAVVTDYCTFSPASGSGVAGNTSITVTATYTAKSGAVFQADEAMPITSLDHIKIITPRNHVIKTQMKATNAAMPEPAELARLFGFTDAYVAAYWKKNDEIVRITTIDLASVASGVADGFSYYEGDTKIGRNAQSLKTGENITFDRYTAPSVFAGTTYDYATAFSVSYKTGVDTTYFECDPFERFDASALPTSYNDTGVLHIYANDAQFWKLKYTKSGLQPLSVKFPYLNSEYPCGTPAFVAANTINAMVSEYDGLGQCVGFRHRGETLGRKVSCLFGNGKRGWFSIGRLTYFPTGTRGYAFIESTTKFSFECADGQITWTITIEQ